MAIISSLSREEISAFETMGLPTATIPISIEEFEIEINFRVATNYCSTLVRVFRDTGAIANTNAEREGDSVGIIPRETIIEVLDRWTC